MNRARCRECAAYNEAGNQCRRHAPLAVPVPQPGGVAAIGIYPSTAATDWCMDYIAPADAPKPGLSIVPPGGKLFPA